MTGRAFPLVHTRGVARLARFYERLGFVRARQQPGEGEPVFVALRRGDAELALSAEPPHGGEDAAGGPGRWRLVVFVEAVDEVVARLAADGVRVVRQPRDMPWGERMALVTDPDGNHVSLASAPAR